MNDKSPLSGKGKFHSISRSEAKGLIENMPSGDHIREASDIFQVLSDPTRIKILHLLTDQELCVHDLTKILDVSQSSVSHHLKLLRMQRLVKTRREGRAVYYSLADSHVLQLVNQCLDHSAH